MADHSSVPPTQNKAVEDSNKGQNSNRLESRPAAAPGADARGIS